MHQNRIKYEFFAQETCSVDYFACYFIRRGITYGKAHVQLTNLLGSGSSLTIHCQFKDDDLGVHVLVFKDSFEWSFKPNFFIPSTLFFCKIQWQSKLMSFDIYKETRDLQGCSKYCYWDVTPIVHACFRDYRHDLFGKP